MCVGLSASCVHAQVEPGSEPLPPRPEPAPETDIQPEPLGPPELEVRLRESLAMYGNEGAVLDLDAFLEHSVSHAEVARNNGALPIVAYVYEHPLELENLELDLFNRVAAAATQGTLDVCAPLIAYGLGIFEETNSVYVRAQVAAAQEDPAAMQVIEDEIFAIFQSINERRDKDAGHMLDFAKFLRSATDTSINDQAKYMDLLSDDFTSTTLPTLIGPHFLRLGEMADSLQDIVNSTDAITPPDNVKEVVPEGLIHYAEPTPDGWIIVGSVLNNVYNMDKILVVFDPAGDDVFNYSHVQIAQLQAVFDLAGNDKHIGTVDGAGPATAVMGMSILIDFAGDDLYTSNSSVSVGAGFFGCGLLIDHKGNDTYQMTGADSAWGIGAGIHGAGMIIDRDGDDTYISKGLGVGVGGINGFGAVLDAMGRDTYTAQLHDPSTDDVNYPRSIYGFGSGVGVHGFAQGGLGVLYDLSGTDTYNLPARAIATEYGMGVFHDESGNDILRTAYAGAATAAATNSSVVVAVDNDGDDVYQGALATAESNSIALLIDRGGKDSYTNGEPVHSGPRGSDDSIASASGTSLAVLIDVNGDDTYTCDGGLIGQSGNDTYDAESLSIARSFSFLIDLLGTDTFNVFNETRRIDKAQFAAPGKPAKNADGTLTGSSYGLIIDIDEVPKPKQPPAVGPR